VIGVEVKVVVGAGAGARVAEDVEAEERDIEDEAVVGQVKAMTVAEWSMLAADSGGRSPSFIH
jgi:hypothetical protein